jgi:hypothetical protein
LSLRLIHVANVKRTDGGDACVPAVRVPRPVRAAFCFDLDYEHDYDYEHDGKTRISTSAELVGIAKQYLIVLLNRAT